MAEKMRLQKYMSRAGICSRRKAEEYIAAGEVQVNGKIATIWQSVDPEKDQVTLWNRAILEQESFVYYKVHKPRGIETTCAQHGTDSILDIVNIPERVFPVGRLDKESDGLIILTNDGRMTNYLTHPRYGHEKEYLVEVFGPIDDNQLDTMRRGVHILGSKTKKAKIERVASWKFTIILTEWKNRQIRRMVEKVWGEVKKLKRIRIENIHLWKMKSWDYRELSKNEKKELFEKLDLQ